MEWKRAAVFCGFGFVGLGAYLWWNQRFPRFPKIKLTRAAMVSYWPPKRRKRMTVACLRPDPPAPSEWIPAIYEVPAGDFARFPRTFDPGRDAYYYDKTPWEFYERVSWHLLLSTTHDYVVQDIWPSNEGWMLVIDSMWWSHRWYCPCPHDLFSVSGHGYIE